MSSRLFMVPSPSSSKKRDEYTRPQIEDVVIRALEENGAMSTRELAHYLFDNDRAYTVIRDTRYPIGVQSLHYKLSGLWHLELGSDNKWRYQE